jgi:hypothetical protein
MPVFNSRSTFYTRACVKEQKKDKPCRGPALAFGSGLLYLAWAGPDNKIAISSSVDGVTWNKVLLQQWTLDSPSLTFIYPYLYLCFRGTNSDQIYVCRTLDGGQSLDSLTVVPNIATDYTPALIQQGTDLILAWRDSASPHHINAMRADMSNPSINPLKSFGIQVVFSDTSNGGVALATYFGQAYIAWGGTDANTQLNIWNLPPSF